MKITVQSSRYSGCRALICHAYTQYYILKIHPGLKIPGVEPLPKFLVGVFIQIILKASQSSRSTKTKNT